MTGFLSQFVLAVDLGESLCADRPVPAPLDWDAQILPLALTVDQPALTTMILSDMIRGTVCVAFFFVSCKITRLKDLKAALSCP